MSLIKMLLVLISVFQCECITLLSLIVGGGLIMGGQINYSSFINGGGGECFQVSLSVCLCLFRVW